VPKQLVGVQNYSDKSTK